ncbi:l1 transposable element-related [Holotrichia oblita]|uniref:L1 transposable element-related n=1 Tax=Holotrichia oblita TaxID=644536 RepID=A0ACB9TJZ9_HOLOL|nr:l1 transposable element-related [Holotrichia oblita]
MGDSEGRVTRSKSNDADECLIQKVVEKELSNKQFLDKLVETIKDILQVHETRLTNLEDGIVSTNNKISNILDNLEYQEQYSRSNNLRVFGLPETPTENVENTIVELCEKKLGIKITANDIDSCHRLSGKEGSQRPIIVKFCRRSVRDIIFKFKRKLKGSKIIIREDLTKRRFAVLQDLVKKFDRKSVFTSSGNIFVVISGVVKKIKYLSDLEQVMANSSKKR